ncbi:MAG: hypothetical protein DWH97_13220 [Planctomycetota bacterium]|nr:MAG: hypothetical protein DWH97_13220 [Planctomycetota bacterium]
MPRCSSRINRKPKRFARAARTERGLRYSARKKLTLACSFGCTLALLLTACQGVVDGMPEIIDDENDDNQDPNIGEPI